MLPATWTSGRGCDCCGVTIALTDTGSGAETVQSRGEGITETYNVAKLHCYTYMNEHDNLIK